MLISYDMTVDRKAVNNAKEYYDYYVKFDSTKAAYYKGLIKKSKLIGKQESVTTIKDSTNSAQYQVKKVKPLRLRKPKNGFSKTIAETIEEILIEKDRPLTAKELLLFILEKGRDVGELKDFSSQLITLSKKKNRFFREKIKNINFWGLSEWYNIIGFKIKYREKIKE